MRKGDNPLKFKQLIYKNASHRVIIPVYIPNEEGYFSHSLQSLILCLTSLFQTVHKQTSIAIIANGCCDKVLSYLQQLVKDGKIDTLTIHHENKGKVDSVLSEMRGSIEPLITISDSDVLFKVGWQEAVEKIYANFPNVGMVSPIPLPNSYNTYTGWSWFCGLFQSEIVKAKNEDLESILEFKKSIGMGNELNEIEQKPYYLKFKGELACIGASHFCATYNRNLMPFIPLKKSGPYINNAEKDFLDAPVENGGFLRLSTTKGYVYHIGNVPEEWMNTVIESNINFDAQPIPIHV
jgi:hypothetical protein